MISSPDINAIYQQLIKDLLKNGISSAPRGKGVIELPNVGFMLENARNSIITIKSRKLNYAYAAIEMFGLLREGKMNVEPYTWYNSQMKQFLNPEHNTWDGSYGNRIYLYDQLEKMAEILKADPNSRRAVLSLYNPAHDFHDYESRDVCCTLSLIFSIRDGALNLTCTMRSNDIMLGLPYDLTQFTFLQSVLATWLGITVGWYYHFTANLHAYEEHFDKLKEISEDTAVSTKWDTMPRWDCSDATETKRLLEHFFAYDGCRRLGHNNVVCPKSSFLSQLDEKVFKPYVTMKLNKAK